MSALLAGISGEGHYALAVLRDGWVVAWLTWVFASCCVFYDEDFIRLVSEKQCGLQEISSASDLTQQASIQVACLPTWLVDQPCIYRHLLPFLNESLGLYRSPVWLV